MPRPDTSRDTAPLTGAVSLPMAEASAATGAPAAALHRYTGQDFFDHATARGVDRGHFPRALLPVLTTLRVMELAGCTLGQMRAIGAILTTRVRAVRTDEDQHRLTRQLRTVQIRLVENGPRIPELSEIIAHPPFSTG